MQVGINHVIVIDDFEVPSDLGYGFDDFGSGKRLSVDYLRTVSGNFDLYVFFPRAPSSEETGNKRGAAFITTSSAIAAKLKSLTELRFFEVLSVGCAQSPDPIPR